MMVVTLVVGESLGMKKIKMKRVSTGSPDKIRQRTERERVVGIRRE